MVRFLKVAALLSLALSVLGKLYNSSADPDLWGYLAFGRELVETGRFPYADVFAYTGVKPLWVYHEWLTGTVFYVLAKAFGLGSLQVVKYALAFLVLAVAYAACRVRGSSFWTSLLCLLPATLALSSYSHPLRAQLFSALFFVSMILILERTEKRGGMTAGFLAIPALLALWGNLHGGVAVGFVVLAAYGLGHALRRDVRGIVRYAAVAGAGLLATLLNPYGYRYWTYLYEALAMPRPKIFEWMGLIESWRQGMAVDGSIAFLAVLLVSAGLLVKHRKSARPSDFAMLAAFAYFGFSTVRHQMFLLLAGPIYVSAFLDLELARLLPVLAERRVRAALACTAALFLAVVGVSAVAKGDYLALAPGVVELPNGVAMAYPVHVAEYLQERGIKGNILTEFGWGEYFIYALPKESYKIAMDGRYETVFTDETCDAFFAFMAGQGSGILKETDIVVLHPLARAAAVMDSLDGWKALLRDDRAVLYVRAARRAGA